MAVGDSGPEILLFLTGGSGDSGSAVQLYSAEGFDDSGSEVPPYPACDSGGNRRRYLHPAAD